VQSDNKLPHVETSLELKDQNSEIEVSALKDGGPEAQTRQPVREQLIQRFEKWLDDVLAEEEPLEGIAEELLSELEDRDSSGTVRPTDSKYDLYSTWSAITALTQEVKLQGRAFQHLSDKMEPLLGTGESTNRLLEAHKETLYDVRLIAEEARAVRTKRENELVLDAQDRVRRGLISVLIDIRDRLIIGLRSADKGRRKLNEYRNSSLPAKIFFNKSAGINHMVEIVSSLKKGYGLGLDRLDEVMQQLGIHEIICEGKPFNPRLMNVVDVEETLEAPDGMVLEVYRAGYMFNSEVLRPVQVKVARAPERNISEI